MGGSPPKRLPTLRRLWQASCRRMDLALLWALATFAATGAQIMTARLLGDAGQTALGGDPAALARLLGLTAALAGALMLAQMAAHWAQNRFKTQTALSFRRKTSRHLGQADYAWLEGQRTGDLLTRAQNNIADATNFLGQQVPTLVAGLLAAALCAAYLFAANWQLMLVYLAPIPLAAWVQTLSSKPMQKASQLTMEADGRRSSLAQDALTNLTTVRAYGLEEDMARRYQQRYHDWFKARMGTVRVIVRLIPLGFILSMMPICLFIIVAALMIFRGQYSLGELITALVIILPLSSSLMMLSQWLIEVRQSAAGAQRIFELWDAPRQPEPVPAEPDLTAPEVLCLQDAQFAYDPARPVLRGVSFTVVRGEKVALVGPSGCGKSTIIKLISGLYPLGAGALRLWGQDATASAAAFRPHMAVVPQDCFLFPDTLAANIADGAPEATEDAVAQAARHAGIDFADTLPQGLQTMLAERGMNLSGGQRQRVAIARALIRNAPLILMDEATAALDAATERALQTAFDTLLLGRTAVIVAHRLSSIRQADRILVLDEGRIIEEGTHESLLALDGLYARLYRSQSDDGEVA